jgi:2-polyprenyl-6-methoxyphenol hydroxylase-like FAD-dependent oxidoreductase
MRPAAQALKIGIIGAGTAGLAAAIAFRRIGCHVTVFERHESLGIFGAGLLIQPQGINTLTALGMREEFVEVSVPITLLEGKNHRGWKLVDIPYRGQEARAISRFALANLLSQHLTELGSGIIFNADVEQLRESRGKGLLTVNGREHEFDLLVIAGGASSTLPAQAGLSVPSTKYKWGALWGMFDVENWRGERVLQQRFHTIRQMYGLMPTERVGQKLRLSFFWSLPCNAYEAWKNSSLEEWKKQLIDLWPESIPVVSQIHSHDQLTFATYRHAWPKRLAASPVCVIGDAAHSMSPQLGLGATLAMQDAFYLAHYISNLGLADGLKVFSKKRLRTAHAYQTLSRALTPCFQADNNGFWRDTVFALSLYVPGVRYLMYRSVAEPHSSLRLAESAQMGEGTAPNLSPRL